MEKKINDQPQFSINVPLNNEIFLKERKKSGIKLGIISLFAPLLFAGLFIWSLISGDTNIVISIIFAILAIVLIWPVIFLFRLGKNKPKNDNLLYKFEFFEEGLSVSRNFAKDPEVFKNEKTCLYHESKNLQYICKVFEYSDRFTFKILTGTYNMSPQYDFQILPKDVFKDEKESKIFKEFLQKTFEKDLIIKNK